MDHLLIKIFSPIYLRTEPWKTVKHLGLQNLNTNTYVAESDMSYENKNSKCPQEKVVMEELSSNIQIPQRCDVYLLTKDKLVEEWLNILVR